MMARVGKSIISTTCQLANRREIVVNVESQAAAASNAEVGSLLDDLELAEEILNQVEKDKSEGGTLWTQVGRRNR